MILQYKYNTFTCFICDLVIAGVLTAADAAAAAIDAMSVQFLRCNPVKRHNLKSVY